jgi:uncharacterized membrane protein YqjE
MFPESQIVNDRPARNLGTILAEIKDELQTIIETRINLLRTELRYKAAHWKFAFPSAGLALLFAVVAYLLINISIVALIAVFIPGPFRWFFAFLALGILWLVLGGIAAYVGIREMELKRVLPRRTIETLKGDKVWLQKEMSKPI